MSILNQNLLTLDFWQDKVTYGKQTANKPFLLARLAVPHSTSPMNRSQNLQRSASH